MRLKRVYRAMAAATALVSAIAFAGSVIVWSRGEGVIYALMAVIWLFVLIWSVREARQAL